MRSERLQLNFTHRQRPKKWTILGEGVAKIANDNANHCKCKKKSRKIIINKH